ncbi:hypothetical protein GCM10028818_30710 [Spirosoma horti]
MYTAQTRGGAIDPQGLNSGQKAVDETPFIIAFKSLPTALGVR